MSITPVLSHLPVGREGFVGVSIVIPVYNALDYAAACVESLYRARETTPIEVIVVDNGSTPVQAELWLKSEQARSQFWFVRYDQPLGFAGAVNIGVKLARGEHVVILNSDTVVTDGWLTALVDAMHDPNMAVVSPVTNHAGGVLQQDPDAVMLRVDQAQAYARQIAGRREIIDTSLRLTFFCVLVRRTVWDELSGLDEGYRTGNYEDDDFCLRVLMLGYKLGVVRHSFVYHHNNTTFKVNNLGHGAWMSHNERRFYARAAQFALSSTPAPRDVQTPVTISLLYLDDHADASVESMVLALNSQLLRPFELVVVTRDANAAERFKNATFAVQIVDSAPRNGFGAHLKTALSRARGAWIGFIDEAVTLYPMHLSTLHEVVTRQYAQGSYTRWCALRPGADGADERGVVPLRHIEWWNRAAWRLGHDIRLDCVLVERSAFNRLGVTDEDTPDTLLRRLIALVTFVYTFVTTFERRVPPEQIDPEWFALPEMPAAHGAVSAPAPNAPARMTPQQWKQRQARKQVIDRAQTFLYRSAQRAFEIMIPSQELRVKISNRVRKRLGLPTIPATDRMLVQYAIWDMQKHMATFTADGSAGRALTDQPDVFMFNIIEWSALKQRPQHFAEQLAARGCRVFWIDVHLKPIDNVLWWDLQPFSQPIPHVHYIELPGEQRTIYMSKVEDLTLEFMLTAIEAIKRAYAVEKAVCLVHYLRWTPLVIRLAQQYAWKIVYDCLDNAPAFGAMYRTGVDASMEHTLTQRAHLVTASAQNLKESVQKFNPNTHLIRNAADYDLFSTGTSQGLLDDIPTPRIGFFGAFAEWLDIELIGAAAHRFPHYSFVFIGREVFPKEESRSMWASVKRIENVFVFDQVDHPTLAAMTAQLDVTTIPFLDLPITQAMNTVKAYEYLAAGKPVIARDLPEARLIAEENGLITLYRTPEGYFEALEREVSALHAPEAAQRVIARKQYAATHTWSQRTDMLLRLIDSLFD